VGEKYDFERIEKKWQKYWEENKLFKTGSNPKRPKYYYLDMFPYPSGELHMGHIRNYVMGDVISRHKVMQGFNVLHPMGWDAFGLPAENAAIAQKIHPTKFVPLNIAKMKEQIKRLGISYDWEREINSSSPEYYKWTQWIFVQMHKRGLAYRKLMPINWCPHCKTGLANEEVVEGRCERCGAEVTKKDLKQWMLKITSYADRLLYDLDKLDWPEKVKVMQANWIGRSEGAEVIFKIASSKEEIPVFTTRPDTLFGATYMVLAPEHPLVPKITTKEDQIKIEEYIEKSRKESEVDRLSTVKEKTGVFTGRYALNPVNNQKIPIFIADYVLLGYGTGAIMAVPAHDGRDFEFAKKFNLKIIEVISSPQSKKDKTGELEEAYTEEGILVNSGKFNKLKSESAKEKITQWLIEKNLAKKRVNYKLRDWVFSRQRYWGEPIPIVHCQDCGEVPVKGEDLPIRLPKVEKYQPTGTGESPLAAIKEFVNCSCPRCGREAKRETDTMPQWAGSCWYFLRFVSPHLTSQAFDSKEVNHWLPVNQYVGGIEHAILHLLYARFFTKVLYDLGKISFDEPFAKLFNQGMITKDGAKMSKSKGNIVSPDEIIKKSGADTLRLFILFVGPPEQDAEWSEQGVEGAFRFLNRVWREVGELKGLKNKGFEGKKDKDLRRITQKTIKKVSEDIELRLHFNTAISSIMELVNALYQYKEKGSFAYIEAIESLILLLSPFAPHIAEELWQAIGKEKSIYQEMWPSWDKEAIKEEEITIVLQINGKLRDKILVPPDLAEKELKELVLQRSKIKAQIAKQRLVKFIFVPGRLVNLVVK